jgi:outer membrane lipopolysaccharide assembly protein LptE/RlpB
MSYDKTLALAKQREEMFLRDTLAAELADQLMRRLSALPKQPVPVEPTLMPDGTSSTAF